MELTTSNKMLDSTTDKSLTTLPKRTRRQRTPSPAPEPSTHKTPQQQFKYLRGLSNRERVDAVLSRMYGEHRWTIKDLIHYMVTEEQEKSYTASTEKRARDISKAIFDNPKVVDALSHASNHLRNLQILNMAELFRKELCSFQSQLGFGKFDAEDDPRDFNIPELVDRAKKIAPGLWHFLYCVIGSEPNAAKDVEGAFFTTCMVLAHLNAPRKSNVFHMLLGIHLHSMGVKRRTINLLSGLGVTVNYRTITNHIGEIANLAAVSIRALNWATNGPISLTYPNLL
jgi:hypothetical protein